MRRSKIRSIMPDVCATLTVGHRYWPGMWSTIALQFLYIGITGFMSWHFTRQNKLAEEVRPCRFVSIIPEHQLIQCRARSQPSRVWRASDTHRRHTSSNAPQSKKYHSAQGRLK